MCALHPHVWGELIPEPLYKAFINGMHTGAAKVQHGYFIWTIQYALKKKTTWMWTFLWTNLSVSTEPKHLRVIYSNNIYQIINQIVKKIHTHLFLLGEPHRLFLSSSLFKWKLFVKGLTMSVDDEEEKSLFFTLFICVFRSTIKILFTFLSVSAVISICQTWANKTKTFACLYTLK